MKVSARDPIKGVMKSVTKGRTAAQAVIGANDAAFVASTTIEAVDEWKLRVGQAAYALAKASDVLIGVAR